MAKTWPKRLCCVVCAVQYASCEVLVAFGAALCSCDRNDDALPSVACVCVCDMSAISGEMPHTRSRRTSTTAVALP